MVSEQRSTDPDFSAKTRVLYRLIKATHHLNNVTASEAPPRHRLIKAVRHLRNVSDTDPPITIYRMTRTLSTCIKPAAPTESTMLLIDANAKNWAHTTMIILRDHYIDMIDKQIETLTGLTDPNWKQLFEIAAVWARRNSGRQLLPETRAEVLLIVRVTNREQSDPPVMTKDKTGLQQTDLTSDQRLRLGPQHLGDRGLFHQWQPKHQPHQGGTTAVVTADIRLPPPTTAMLQEATIPKSPARAPMSLPTSMKTSATMMDIRGGWSPEIQVEEEEIIPPTPFSPPHVSRDISWAAPKAQRTKRTPDPRSSEQEPLITLQADPPPGEQLLQYKAKLTLQGSHTDRNTNMQSHKTRKHTYQNEGLEPQCQKKMAYYQGLKYGQIPTFSNTRSTGG